MTCYNERRLGRGQLRHVLFPSIRGTPMLSLVIVTSCPHINFWFPHILTSLRLCVLLSYLYGILLSWSYLYFEWSLKMLFQEERLPHEWSYGLYMVLLGNCPPRKLSYIGMVSVLQCFGSFAWQRLFSGAHPSISGSGLAQCITELVCIDRVLNWILSV